MTIFNIYYGRYESSWIFCFTLTIIEFVEMVPGYLKGYTSSHLIRFNNNETKDKKINIQLHRLKIRGF